MSWAKDSHRLGPHQYISGLASTCKCLRPCLKTQSWLLKAASDDLVSMSLWCFFYAFKQLSCNVIVEDYLQSTNDSLPTTDSVWVFHVENPSKPPWWLVGGVGKKNSPLSFRQPCASSLLPGKQVSGLHTHLAEFLNSPDKTCHSAAESRLVHLEHDTAEQKWGWTAFRKTSRDI